MARYILVTPAKDEEQFIERTIASVLNQTVRPAKWVFVDDGSRDRTPEILQKYASQHDWIVVHQVERDSDRKLGSAEIRAFETGYEMVSGEPFDFIVKLDSDLEMPPTYFERLLEKFAANERLGIASGVYLEQHNGEWSPIDLPPYHAAGAAKMVRRQCFLDMGHFPLYPGWDTADEIKAQAKDWETTHFPEIQFYHLRHEGSAYGGLKTHVLHGEVYYVCDGGLVFFLLKLAHRLVSGKPFIVGGVMLLYGYLRAILTRRPKLLTKEEGKLYRRLLNQRIREQVGGLFDLSKWKNRVWRYI